MGSLVSMCAVRRTGWMWLLSAAMLAGCGGGSGDEATPSSMAAQGASARGFVEQMHAAQSGRTQPRRRTLGATAADQSAPAAATAAATSAAASALVDPAALFDWAEWTYPALFPKGPQNYPLSYLGVSYTVRSYANGNNLGVTPGGDIFGLGPFTGNALQGFGNSASYAAQVQADACKVSPQSCASLACLIDGSTPSFPNGKVCFASLPVPFTCSAAGMHRSAAAYLATTGATSYTYTSVAQCPAGVVAGQASALVTVSGSGQASTLAGTAVAATTFAGPDVDGAASVARFYFAASSTASRAGIASDGTSLYVADPGHYAIRKVSLASGAVSTLAGTAAGVAYPTGFPSGFADGVGSAAFFSAPAGLAISPDRSALFVADGRYVRKIAVASGTVSTLAYAAPRTSATFTNLATNALDFFRGAIGVATDGAVVYVLDADINAGSGGAMRLLKIDLATNAVRSLAVAIPVRTQAITLDGNALYLAGGGSVSKVDLATLARTTLAGSVDSVVSRDGVGSAAGFTLQSEGIVSDGSSLYIADGALVRQVVLATGVVSTVAGGAEGYADGVGDAARVKRLGGLVRVDGALYATDNLSAIRKIVP